jgi:hypothetical protein
MRRMLTVIHGKRFIPSDQQREMVAILVFNETPIERIAAQVGCSMDELRYLFDRELNLSKDQLLAVFTRNIFDLANQRQDLGVALKASELLVKSRVKAFREPRDEPLPPPVLERIDTLNEDEVDREIQRVLGRQPAPGAADAEEAPVGAEAQPD